MVWGQLDQPQGENLVFPWEPPENSKGSTYWRYETDGEKPLNIEIQVDARRLEATNQTTLKAPRVLGDFVQRTGKAAKKGKGDSGNEKPPDTELTDVSMGPPNDTQSVAAASQPADGEQNDALTGNQKKDRSRSPGRRRKDIVAETQLDSPDGKQQGTKKLKLGSPNKSFYPPSDPDDAKRKGWSEVDLGGDGDCFYRCISYFLEKDPSKVTPEFAKNAASFIRVKLVAHARKHENRFAEFFPSTRGFAEWADATLQNNTWIEGAALQACSERNGLAIVIWSWRPKDNSWTRFTIAPRFSDGQACWAKGTSPATVILRNKHYTILKPPEDTKTPISWLRETPNTVIDFSGGGKPKTSSRYLSCGSSKAPSVRTMGGFGSPSVHSKKHVSSQPLPSDMSDGKLIASGSRDPDPNPTLKDSAPSVYSAVHHQLKSSIPEACSPSSSKTPSVHILGAPSIRHTAHSKKVFKKDDQAERKDGFRRSPGAAPLKKPASKTLNSRKLKHVAKTSGAVSSKFQISADQGTIADGLDFLNSVDPEDPSLNPPKKGPPKTSVVPKRRLNGISRRSDRFGKLRLIPKGPLLGLAPNANKISRVLMVEWLLPRFTTCVPITLKFLKSCILRPRNLLFSLLACCPKINELGNAPFATLDSLS